ncbi:hypothetical protein D7X94_18015, partial [Acutalibacter sp. 1XD8-33]|uniref:hypothetical protein n=1 Tax=Acutalibacter sp. 1XD8-33 TaxID=2320081 RepID=UPI000EDFFF08
FFQNVRIVLRKGTTGTAPDAAPTLTELQINGYQAVWDKDKDIGGENRELNYYVSSDFEFSTGDGQHPARISLKTNAKTVSIPAQNAALVSNRYWSVAPQTPALNRLGKPVSGTAYIPNVKIDMSSDPCFVLRLTGNDGQNYDYTIHIKKAQDGVSTKPKSVKLVKKVAGEWVEILSTYNQTQKQFNFQLDSALWTNG